MSGTPRSTPSKGPRWWPAAIILGAAVGTLIWIRARADWSFQQRTLYSLALALGTGLLLSLWWLTLSRTPWRLRFAVAGLAAAVVALSAALFRIRGVSGDVLPILEPRWTQHNLLYQPRVASGFPAQRDPVHQDFSQFLGPNRTGILDRPALDADWTANPPRLLWRQPVGAAWSGWAVVDACALTQEQRGEEECCTCYETLTGRCLWSHPDAAHYHTTIAGEGPRCTPTVVSNRVFTLGASGILNCLDLKTGNPLWSHNIVRDAKSRVPEWGFAGSPLVYDGQVVVSAGGTAGHSLLAYKADSGKLLWTAGDRPLSYSSPFLATLAGHRQILAFNARHITAHDADSGKVLWEYPWGIGQPQVAEPVVVGPDQVLFSSGYGVGSELLELKPGKDTPLVASRVWRSRKMKAKFANLVQRQGFLYGLDDGILACLDLKDGSQRWKEGRYGHGQGLLVRDLLLLMAENGELVLLRPTPEAPNELHRFRVFHSKTWNPIALAGDLLLARNDQQAACLRLATDIKLTVAAQAP